jgi:hypothetical protein
MRVSDGLPLKGKVELFVTKGRPSLKLGKLVQTSPVPVYADAEIDLSSVEILESETLYNILTDQGKDRVLQSLTSGFIRTVARMAVGDRGTIPSDPTVPKVPVSTMTGLYNEVYREDLDATVLNIGTPGVHEVKFIKTFSAQLVPITSFSNQANPVVNEVGLVMCDLLGGAPLPRTAVAAPSAPPADEVIFSIRTFKSVPFEAANDISVTIRYTVFIE